MITHFRVPSPDKGSQELTEEYISLRAYELFEEHGRTHGHDLEDWLQAEAEILGTHPKEPTEPDNGIRLNQAA